MILNTKRYAIKTDEGYLLSDSITDKDKEYSPHIYDGAMLHDKSDAEFISGLIAGSEVVTVYIDYRLSK